MKDLSREYDELFRLHGGNIPVPFLRALAWRESRLRHQFKGAASKTVDYYWGLLQVGYRDVMPEYNKREGASYAKEDLLDAATNIKIASALIERIVRAYGAISVLNDSMQNLREDWTNPEFVKLVVAGWNSGWSLKAGVQYVALRLSEEDILATHNSVFQNAQRLGGVKWLHSGTAAGQRKWNWQRSVWETYRAQPDWPIENVRVHAVEEAQLVSVEDMELNETHLGAGLWATNNDE